MEIINELKEALEFTFMQRALLVGSFVGLSCALLGYFLVLRKYSLIGDGLSHVSFATIALALLLGFSPIYFSLPLIMLASFAILFLTEKTKMYSDSAIGLVSTTGIALGVFIASIAHGFNIDLFSYLFGSILAISHSEVILSIVLSCFVLFIVYFYYHDLFSITFDSEFASVSGLNTKLINTILILTTSVTIVLGIRVVGTMLVSSLIIFPTVTALQLANSFKTGLILASIVSLFSVISGIFLSYLMDFPTGATIVLLNFLLFILSYMLGQFKKVLI